MSMPRLGGCPGDPALGLRQGSGSPFTSSSVEKSNILTDLRHTNTHKRSSPELVALNRLLGGCARPRL